MPDADAPGFVAAFPELRTARLRLRAVTPEDDGFFRAMLAVPEVTRYSNWPDAPDAEEAARMVGKVAGLFAAGHGCGWIIEETASGEPIGSIRFNWFDRAWRCGGVGYEALPRSWGRGLMTEALRAVAACGHEAFALNRIEAWTLPGNGASDRVLEKAGFRHEGTLREKAFFKGRFHDFRMSGRTAADPLQDGPTPP